MNIQKKIKQGLEAISKHPIRNTLSLGLAGLVLTTALKSNVHFSVGSLKIENPLENHYVWGVHPAVIIKGGKSKGNIYTIGLLGAINLLGEDILGEDSRLKGDMNAYGLLGGGNLLTWGTMLTGNMNAYGTLLGKNELGYHSWIRGDMNAYGVLVSGNKPRISSFIKEGNMSSAGLISKLEICFQK